MYFNKILFRKYTIIDKCFDLYNNSLLINVRTLSTLGARLLNDLESSAIYTMFLRDSCSMPPVVSWARFWCPVFLIVLMIFWIRREDDSSNIKLKLLGDKIVLIRDHVSFLAVWDRSLYTCFLIFVPELSYLLGTLTTKSHLNVLSF